MSKFLAQVLLIALGLGVSLANYWYTFGLWPKSWVSYFSFGLALIVLLLLREAVEKEDK